MQSEGSEDSDVGLVRSRLSELFKRPVESGHKIQTLVNGDQIFPSMQYAIAAAQEEICFETFIYWSGDIARQFATALSDAAERGVEVLVILDWWGAQRMDSSLINKMRKAGVVVRYFNPLRWWKLHRMNYRTHRKILVVDREVAFTGGVGIAQQWLGDARSPNEWHDIHYRVTGPVVRDLREAFQKLWSEVLEQPVLALHVDAPPPRTAQHTLAAQVVTSSPRNGSKLIYRLFRHAIETATDSLLIMTAYFVPDQDTISSLVAAVNRGVSVEVMLPGPYVDSALVRFSSRSCWGKMLRAGVRIHIYQPTMLHAKVMVVDHSWVIIGSANFDNRSFSLNDEIVINVCDEEFARAHIKIFRQDCERCKPCSYQDWRHRGLLSRSKEALSDLVRAHL